jgi:uncharacterized repeat protein (TIGR03803 family)
MMSRHAIVATLVTAAALAPVASTAQTETVIHSFLRHANPYAAPLIDRTGALLVPTYAGRKWGDVARVFARSGGWSKRTVFIFDGSDGEDPSGSLLLGQNDTMYGLTNFGGTGGYGTAYSLTPTGNHGWSGSVLYNFKGTSDGGQPRGTLVRDKATGILYGTADGGGTSNCGTAFALTPSNGTWSYTVIHTFGGGNDGCFPGSGIGHRSGKGVLLGTTASGGTSNDGTVFQLTQSKGKWHSSVLYAFKGGNDGIYPGDVVCDKAGHIFGVAGGGASGAGVVYELTRAGQAWQQSVLYSFTGGTDGGGPTGLLLEPATGTVFGTTQYGGSHDDGTLFKLVSAGGSWTESVVYSFGSTPHDGRSPSSHPIEDPITGTLYGTTSKGGEGGDGTLYQITQ